MIVSKKPKYTLISSDENSFKEFQNVLFEKINSFQKENLILQISEDINIENKDFLLFLDTAEQKLQNGTSFVVVNSTVNVDDFPENLNIVPTLQEAEDILEMEAIERELDF
ncbi:hypothetical protein CW731_06925 [Polaribacter sp. ALD11]|uniref:hypothetical protein n=1 Tax=Polaribacter sp. ALD11 TaxID=2058137 RepID=UPI000C304239|nr:hypothetical protein [Polaribacter sp. ALD11]AUC85036.1 hypothetical protein CW731_06925 [Polaribacter sp. ALD11]